MADHEQLAAFSYHWRAAGLAETTLRYYLSWLRRLGVDDATTDDWLAAQLADMTPSQRHYALRAARAWGRWRGTGLGRTLKTPKVPERAQPTATSESLRNALNRSGPEPWDVRAAAIVATLWATGMRIGEAHALRWEDVDLEDGLVKVTSSKGRTFRWAVLDRVAIERLQAWQGCDTSSGRVFPVNSRTLQRDVVRLVGLPAHALRRGHAIDWLRKGGSQTSLMVICGWKNPTMVSR
jgi:integrase